MPKYLPFSPTLFFSIAVLMDSATAHAIDTTAPILTMISPITLVTTDATPSFSFKTTEAGSVQYSGDCLSLKASVVKGTNTVTLEGLANGLHDNCGIQILDMAGNVSLPMPLPAFEVNAPEPAKVDFTAWVNGASAMVSFPARINGYEFYRSAQAGCDWSNYTACMVGGMNVLGTAPVSDTVLNNQRSAYYALKSPAGKASNTVKVTAATFKGRQRFATIVFKNKAWLIGGSDTNEIYGEVWSSVDGKNWVQEIKQSAALARKNPRMLVFNKRLWVMGGVDDSWNQKRDIWSSLDGINWTQVTADHGMSADFSLGKAVVFNGKIWAIGLHLTTNNMQIWSSIDGVQWKLETDNPGLPSRLYPEVIVFNGKLWYISDEIWSSADGVSWRQELTGFFVEPDGPPFTSAVVFNSRLWVAGGKFVDGDMGSADQVWSSADGIQWQLESHNGFNGTPKQSLLVLHNQLWVIADSNHDMHDATAYSSDGIHWQYPGFMGRWRSADVVFNNQFWRIGGDGYIKDPQILSQIRNDVWSSADGVYWIKKTAHAAFSPRMFQQAVSYNNRLWMIGGYEAVPGAVPDTVALTGLQPVTDIWSSADGVSWRKEMASTPFTPDAYTKVKVFKDKLWVLNGKQVWTSTDGIHWLQQSAGVALAADYVYEIQIYNNKLWLEGGNAGSSSRTLWTSTDGVNWSLVNSSIPVANIQGTNIVMKAGKLWKFVDNQAWSSTNGIDWVNAATLPFYTDTSSMVLSKNNMIWLLGTCSQFLQCSNEMWRSSNGIDWRKGYAGTVTFPR